jgi:transposase
MRHIQGTSHSQTFSLPAWVGDYVGPDNVVRYIETFVDSLDLAAAGFDRVDRLCCTNGLMGFTV